MVITKVLQHIKCNHTMWLDPIMLSGNEMGPHPLLFFFFFFFLVGKVNGDLTQSSNRIPFMSSLHRANKKYCKRNQQQLSIQLLGSPIMQVIVKSCTLFDYLKTKRLLKQRSLKLLWSMVQSNIRMVQSSRVPHGYFFFCLSKKNIRKVP